jgi:rhamnosyltransferase
LNLQVYLDAGQFRDELFIDFVDNEYCLRLRRRGFSVLRADQAVLYHSVGDTRRYGPFIATNHSPLRRYYKTRNRFLVNRLYRRDFPGHCLFDRVRLTKEIFSILIFEGGKLAKLCMMWRGYLDYRRGRFGKYKE